jgi:hypothetical protein
MLVDGYIQRHVNGLQTRSGAVYSLPWQPIKISSTNPGFKFSSLLEQSLEDEELYGHLDCPDVDVTFSLSPPTSPEPSPPPSPPPFPKAAAAPVPLDLDPSGVLPLPSQSSTSKKRNRTTKSRNKKQSHDNRKRKRESRREEREEQPYQVRDATRKKHVETSKPLDANLNLKDVPIASTGYVGTWSPAERVSYTLDDLVGKDSRFQFDLVEWDGK